MPISYAQLADWEIRRVGVTDQQRLYLRCRNEIAAQIEESLGEALRSRIKLPPEDWDEWTHRYPLARDLTDGERQFLNTMKEALTLRIGSPVALAVALDQYQDPSSSDDPMQWAKTPLGRLVYRGKYADSKSSLAALAAELARFMNQHSGFRSAEALVAIPSHSPRRFSEHLAEAVGALRGVPVVPVADDISTPLKDTDPATRPTPQFRMDDDLVEGKHVVIIDDLIRSGESVVHVARLLDRAGAASVRVLAAVKTMRN